MSAGGLDKKKISFSEGLDSVYDPFPWFVIGDEIENHVPWPEWSDHELNAEVWDESKVKSDLQSEVKIAVPRPSLFEDANPPLLPITVQEMVVSWKRPEEVFRNETLCVFDPSNQDFKLGIPSKVVNYDFFWQVMEILPLLQYYALEYGFEVEWETNSFVANTQGEVWRPWHHVYSQCKAGKGQVHKPVHHVFGKYVVRLFYMGCWRRFVVDDRIPCDKQGKCMLPVTQVPGELWPIFLIKALLKVMSLTRARNYSMIDFPTVTFFTGWMKETQNMFKKSKNQIWRRFSAFLPEYDSPDKKLLEMETPSKKIKEEAGLKKVKEEAGPKKVKEEAGPKKGKEEAGQKKGKEEVDSKKGSSKGPPKKIERPITRLDFCFVLGVIEGMPDVDRTHAICLRTTRTVPLVKATRKEGTKAWKRIRWIYWASKKGLWTDELKLLPYRRLEYITFVREIHKHLIPDPKQEAAIFDIPAEEESTPIDQLSHKAFEPKQWTDFYKIVEFLSALVVYFKPSSFPSGFKVSCMKRNLRKPMASPGSGMSGRRTSHFESPKLKPSGNQPPVVYCESPTGIFLQISLSVCPTSNRRMTGYLDDTFPEVLTVVKATLTVEKFDWRSSRQGEIIGMGKTVGHSSFSLNLSPGRHILKLWINTDCPFVIHLHSNAELFVSRDVHIRSLMVNESDLIINYIEKVSTAFISLAQSFGKPEYRSALRNFYRAIEPGNVLMVGYSNRTDDFIEAFIQGIVVVLKDLVPSLDDLRITQGALQSLFVDPKIACELPPHLPPLSIFTPAKRSAKKQPPVSELRTLSEILLYRWTPEDISRLITVQKVFRGYRVRLLLKCHNPNRKEFKPYAERLKKLCDLMFSPLQREEQVGRMLRQLIVAHPDLLDTFRFHADFAKVNVVDMFTGKVSSGDARAWIPIIRFTIASHSEQPMPCSFYLSCNLEQYVVVVVNNDTQEELFRLLNVVSPHLYESNAKGYTVLAYGWNDVSLKSVNWRLEMVRMKYFQDPHICNKFINSYCHRGPVPSLKTIEMRNFYVPNHRSRICRCHIRIQKRCLVSLRLSVSNPDARFSITISLDKNFGREDAESELEEKLIFKKNSLKGAVLLPSVILEYFNPIPVWENDPGTDGDSSTLYILEALVLDNSWALTKQEWGTVEPIRVSGENWNDSSTSLSSRRQENRGGRKSRSSKKFPTESRMIDNPCWFLQVMIDAPEKSDPVEQFTIEEDRSYADSVRAMKVFWEESDPGRRKRGQDIRLKFLRAMYDASPESAIVGEDEELDRESDGFSLMMRRLSYFSYLTNDESLQRYTKSPRQFPPMPTLDLLGTYGKQSRTVTTKASVAREPVSVLDFETSSAPLISRDRSDYVNNHVRWRLILEEHLREEQKISRQLMEQAYGRRQKVIERLVR